MALVGLGLSRYLRRRGRFVREVGDPALLSRLLGVDFGRPPWRRVLLVLGAAVGLALALIDPHWGEGAGPLDRPGGPVVLVIDVSSSMLVEDVTPNRLALAREAARAIADEVVGAPIGLVIFAGRAHALTAPTYDAAAIELFLDALDPGMVTQTGSALSAALRQGVGLLMAGEPPGGALVVISDGDIGTDSDELVAAIQLAARSEVPVFTIGVGTPGGGPVPDLDPLSGERLGYKTDAEGRRVMARLSDEGLRAIADRTGGIYRPLAAGTVEEVGRWARGASGGAVGARGERTGVPRFAWFASAALLLLVVEGLMMRPRRAVAGLLVAAVGLGACDTRGGAGQGMTGDSVAFYREVAAARPGDPVPLYNLGAVLLQREEFAPAVPPLERATEAAGASLRQAAHYNLGNARLAPAFEASPGFDGMSAEERERWADELRRAAESYREALRLAPADTAAKWNLELALRLLDEARRPPPDDPPPPEPDEGDSGGGGGGGGGGGSQSGQGGPQPSPAEGTPQQPMTREQTEALLSAARDRELGVQRETLRKPQPTGGMAH